MDNYIIDSDVLINITKKRKSDAEIVEKIPYPTISVITMGEMFQGAQSKKQLRQLEVFLKDFIILPLTLEIGSTAINLLKQYLLAHDLTIYDSLIAATALHYECILVTKNIKHFKMIKELKLHPL
jgi:hypothetical protein